MHANNASRIAISRAAACASYQSTERMASFNSDMPAIQALAIVHNEVARALFRAPRGPVVIPLEQADRWLVLIESAAADIRSQR